MVGFVLFGGEVVVGLFDGCAGDGGGGVGCFRG